MFPELTKNAKRALREAAALAHSRDRSMSREDCDVFYLEARNADLPLLIGGAVADGLVTLEEIGESARDLIADIAGRLRAMHSDMTSREPEKIKDPYDPNAVVSVSRIVEELDSLWEGASLYVNRMTGEVVVQRDGDEDAIEDEDGEPVSLEDDPAWIGLFSSFDLNDMEVMKKFANRVAGPAAGKALLEALHGRGAYRRFRDEIHRRRLDDEWDTYRTERRTESVRFRLEQQQIPFKK